MNRSTIAKKGSLETIDDQSYLGIDTNDRLTITRKDRLKRSLNDRAVG